jgi:hypothetical protein
MFCVPSGVHVSTGVIAGASGRGAERARTARRTTAQRERWRSCSARGAPGVNAGRTEGGRAVDGGSGRGACGAASATTSAVAATAVTPSAALRPPSLTR